MVGTDLGGIEAELAHSGGGAEGGEGRLFGEVEGGVEEGWERWLGL